MKEVSCKVFGVHFKELRKKNIPEEQLIVGSSYDLSHFDNAHERVEWSDYIIVMTNARKIWTPAELIEHGGAFAKSPLNRSMMMMARLLFTAKDFFRWINVPQQGGGQQLISCILPTFEEDEGGRLLRITLAMREGYPVCREAFLVIRGGLGAVPRLFGVRNATITMEELPTGARYEIRLPPQNSLLGWLFNVITYPFTARALAVELKRANEVLEARYLELDKAREGLDRQATQLRTSQSIGQLIHSALDLDRTLTAVVRALVDVAGFAAARVRVSTELELQKIEREAASGDPPPEGHSLSLPLRPRGHDIGEVTLWSAAAANLDERRALCDFVIPVIAIAIDDALSYTVLATYRQNLERRVEERTADLAATVERMLEAQKARDRIFANINHELRTPLSLVMLAVSAIERREGARLDEKSRQEIDTIGVAVRRVLRMVDELLLLAAGQEGKLGLRFAPCDVALLLRETVMTWSPAADTHQLRLSFEGPSRCTWNLDAAALDRIVTNLVSNAIKFTPQGGSIEVRLRELGGGDGSALPERIEIEVRDSGIGIDEEFRGRMFGRFEQGRAAVHAGASGSGIGLSVVRQLVEAHGGEIGATSPRSGGTIFRFTLPQQASLRRPSESTAPRMARLAPNDFGLARTNAVAAAAGPSQTTNREAATVLVAEDDPDLRASITELLSQQYKVLVAPDGITALHEARTHLPDILVTDVGMPGRDGLELTRRFRDLPGNRLSPVLLLTAFGGIQDRLSGFDAGAVDYIIKPFEPEELLARVRSQLALRSMALQLHQSEKLSALGVLSAGLAHEIRNPANAIVNAVEPLRSLLPDELTAPGTPSRQLLDVLDRCARQVATLSRQLLGFKRPSAEMLREPTPFDGILDHAVTVVQPAFKHVSLHKELAAGTVLHASAPLLAQVLANLLENAAHAAGSGGWVKVASRVDGERLIVEVSDSGPGVPPALRERIFEAFFTTKPPGKGTGLGLTTSREIVEQHQGILKVMDAAKNSLFRLELPLASADLQPHARSPAAHRRGERQ